MKISYNWLKEFVAIKANPQKLAEDLSLFGHSVESVTKIETCPERPRNNRRGSRMDWILDLEITANRGDCLCILGITHEVRALYNIPITTNSSILHSIRENVDFGKKIKVEIIDSKICPRYTARIIDGVKVVESPKWLKDRLAAIGIRPINNIVDITNYVMIERGQPLHAFDYDKIYAGKMIVRPAKKGESVITLDGIKRQLDEDALVIENQGRLIDLVGIMGGANSEVDKKTKTIILQGAVFDPVLIRRTSKKLGLVTEASYRYERGVDPEGTIYGVDRAAELIKKLCPGAKIGGLIDIQAQKIQPTKIKFNPDQINKLLGTKIAIKDMIKYLDRLGFKIPVENRGSSVRSIGTTQLPNYLTTQPPTYRIYDIKIWQDLAEEIARVHGYAKLAGSLPKKTKTQENKEFNKKEALKDLLTKYGFIEVYSYSFVDEKLLKALGINLNNCRKVINSVAPELKYLRPSLLPSLLTAVAKNPWAPEVKIFEIGRVFQNRGRMRKGTRNDTEGEQWQLGIVTTEKFDTEIKKVLENLKIKAKIESVPQSVLDFLKIRRPVRYVLVDLSKKLLDRFSYPRESVLRSAMIRVRYRKVSEFAPTIRDLAFIVDKKVDSEKIRQTIAKLDVHILLVELFDEFYFDKTSAGSALSSEFDQRDLRNMKNVAYHIWLQDLKGPMKEKEVNKIIRKIIKHIENKFRAKLRK